MVVRLFLSRDLGGLASFQEKEDHHHVMLDLRANFGSEAVVAQRSFLHLDGGEVQVRRQLVECHSGARTTVRCLEPLYGTLPNGRQPAVEGECVICLEKPKEVAILHCRHVCLCFSCAQITSSTWSFQCPVCRGRVAGMVGLQQLPAQ
ncbi:unnamed protein product [Effrenium voratum]|nr:unnamed protein product [Effrenium voratum]